MTKERTLINLIMVVNITKFMGAIEPTNAMTDVQEAGHFQGDLAKIAD